MPRSFDLSAEYADSVEHLHQAFAEADYWRARLADIPVDNAKLESIRVGGESGDDGTIEVVTLQEVHSHNLPAMVTQLHRGDLYFRREETWGPVTDGVATASVKGSIVDTPVYVVGTAELSPIAGGGARLTFHVSIHVRIPLIGGKVEKIIGDHLAELVSREQLFTSQWISNNA
jgi:Protein of unknown function (DUF2505)